ncbi:MAG TPA: acyl-CoA dehydrogenase family protein [Caulobacterales bacterium]|nr:acyl-CoA dehydrogenase family protein [Caulobacterales bacterium]
MMTEPLADTPDRAAIRDAVRAICNRFDDEYWRNKDETASFPFEFSAAIAEGGWLGIAMPAEYGGAALGVTEAAIMMQTIGSSAGAFAACSTVHINIFGPHAIVVHGSAEQKQRFLPPLIAGKERACFGVTEPDAGLDTSKIKTRAVRDGAHYVIDGRKIWTSTAQQADKILLLTRTTPIEECKKPTDGLTLFYTDLDRRFIDVHEIHKMGRAAVNSNAIFIDGLRVSVDDRVGEDGKGFRYLLDSLNPERILNAAEAIGIGRRALSKATQYAKDRIVFGRPIGQNQSIQHPLAENWAELYAAELMMLRAAALYDAGAPCGPEANAAKYLAADAAFKAADQAVRTHGGMGYAREFDVERYFREAVLTRLAPVSRELILCFLAERVLGLPKSY